MKSTREADPISSYYTWVPAKECSFRIKNVVSQKKEEKKSVVSLQHWNFFLPKNKIHLYEIPTKGKFMETESTSAFVWGWGWEWGLTVNGHKKNWGGWRKRSKTRLWYWLHNCQFTKQTLYYTLINGEVYGK